MAGMLMNWHLWGKGHTYQYDEKVCAPICAWGAKYSICNTLAHGARVVCTSQSALKQEEDDIRQALL